MRNGTTHGSSPPHVVLFPFMAKGHTIPLLHFAHLLLRRGVTVTIFTTPANYPFIVQSLHGTATATTIITLPFPDNISPDIPAGTESTDKLPSMSLFYDFALATVAMQPHFEQALETLPHVTFMVTDGFLWWTLHSATKFSIPRLVFFGMSCYGNCVTGEAMRCGILNGSQPDGELVELTRFPWIKLCKEDFEPSFGNIDPSSLQHDFNVKVFSTMAGSYGVLVNSFYELEPTFIDYMNMEIEGSLKYWCVGPFFAESANKSYADPGMKTKWVRWLDQKLEEKCSVLYVAFGTQAEISKEQLKEIAIGLEESEVSFLWVIRKDDGSIPDGYEEKMKGRGMIVREWVDQREILMHQSVKGFLSHCGWNSVLESICAGVPILAWPFMADQHVNTRMINEEIKVGFRVETQNGSVRGFVKWEALRKTVKELMDEEKGKEARKNVKEMADLAKKAMQEGGSSWSTLNALLNEMCQKKEISEE